ncbi:MAG: hypothetical protein KIS94_08430 [Chitinophagales bacterium]|nr:hypothetical protein [Chitinophagales bacterium]
MYTKFCTFALLLFLGLLSVGSSALPFDTSTDKLQSASRKHSPDRENATSDSVANNLREQLLQLSKSDEVPIGYQHAYAYGLKWKYTTGQFTSDMFQATGKNPAIAGWDFWHMDPDITSTIWLMKEHHSRGGINTISWHMPNPVTGGYYNDVSGGDVVAEILPGGSKHALFVSLLDSFSNFINALTDSDGNAIPLIVRPWHEHNGNWFWWGKTHTTEEHFIQLFRFTVQYLKVQKQHSNLLFAISPNTVFNGFVKKFDQHYFYAYPGDDVVDILGLDDYTFMTAASIGNWILKIKFKNSLRCLVDAAAQHEKIPALTEFGQEGVKQKCFWMSRFWKPLTRSKKGLQLAYAMGWRNGYGEKPSGHRFWVTPEGDKSKKNFMKMLGDRRVKCI